MRTIAVVLHTLCSRKVLKSTVAQEVGMSLLLAQSLKLVRSRSHASLELRSGSLVVTRHLCKLIRFLRARFHNTIVVAGHETWKNSAARMVF